MNIIEQSDLVKETYVYGYPIVGMYGMLYRQIVEKGAESTGFQEFFHSTTLATPETTFVPAPNNDTTYSRAWLDLRNGPVVIDAPDTEGRFYSIQFLDLFSETIKNVGKRTTGTKAQRYVIVGPDWTGELPDGCCKIESNTVFVMAFLRILIKSEEDTQNVNRLQKEFSISSLKNDSGAVSALPEFRARDGKEFFETLESVLKLSPIPEKEKKFLEQIEQIKTMPDQTVIDGCHTARDDIDKGGLQFGEEVNHWRIARKGIGNYGDDYMQRAVVWFKGALANCPEESLYPSVFQDNEGAFLDGKNQYSLTFSSGNLPPVSQFWSLTMYIFRNGFLTQNLINRYSIGDRTKNLHYDANGSLTIYIQSDMPSSPEEQANWLPTPAEPFFMTLRLYGPDQTAIDGRWELPPVIKA